MHPFARCLANLEAIIGQLYPGLARIVTLELAHRRARGRRSDGYESSPAVPCSLFDAPQAVETARCAGKLTFPLRRILPCRGRGFLLLLTKLV